LIVEAGGDDAWAVKDIQPQLRRDIEQLFVPEACLPGTSPVSSPAKPACKPWRKIGAVLKRGV
jgi:hypothetical protein